MRRRCENGVIWLTAAFFLMFTVIAGRYFTICFEQKHVSAAEERSEFTINAGESQGTIYDRSMKPLNNNAYVYKAVAVPKALDRDTVVEYALDREEFGEKFAEGDPFIFRCRSDTPESAGLTVFRLAERYSGRGTAHHVLGYISDGEGASGIECSYDKVLRTGSENTVTYTVDGFGRVLIGDGKKVQRSRASGSGVVTTIDCDIQRICERCGSSIRRGAIVVADTESGDILGMASFPDYSPDDISAALSDEDSPLINRCLYSYSVGSIFKLVTACEAIDEGIADKCYECCGHIDVDGQNFNCHKLAGHGMQSMNRAMTNSCNTYFIALSRELDAEAFRKKAAQLGFGRETYLCSSMSGSAGVLPGDRELCVPAELANFSFGQGKLTATPLQITQLCCAIANGGEMPALRIIRGLTIDGKSVSGEKFIQSSRAMDVRTAGLLRQMMVSAVSGNPESKARSEKVTSGAKTSTAQTGRFDEKGEEMCHAWITGFFPADNPKYAVTVLVEDGGYGNDSAAPVFREIAEGITRLYPD
jgi:penicillin-binding protein 2